MTSLRMIERNVLRNFDVRSYEHKKIDVTRGCSQQEGEDEFLICRRPRHFSRLKYVAIVSYLMQLDLSTDVPGRNLCVEARMSELL